MYVRQKKNISGIISVQIIDKSTGKYKVIKTIGSSADDKIVEQFYSQAKQEIAALQNQPIFNFEIENEKLFVDTFFNGINEFKLLGPEILLGKLFDQIGFNAIQDELFRDLVITRLVYPVSKLKTVDYLFKYRGIHVPINKVYRYLDKLQKDQISKIQDISYHYAINVLQADISIVFYDVTTLYFEAQDEDDLRKTGFSKDGKHQNIQIVLGLVVNNTGYPLAYEIFEGNKFEGHTMLPVIEVFKKKYNLQQLIIVADAGLMSNKNIKGLCEKEYKFIIGARIKNESEAIKKQILLLKLKDGDSAILQSAESQRIIISYSVQRAKRDAYNRKIGVEKLEKNLKTGKLTKKNITNKGYNKYLTVGGNIAISIDYKKYNDDAKLDGLKGYLTNTNFSKEEVITHYKKLWNIEKTFRISKTDLKIR
ncbi:MAG: IS1634 family transposase, partial [Nanoarchaeota archaeon]